MKIIRLIATLLILIGAGAYTQQAFAQTDGGSEPAQWLGEVDGVLTNLNEIDKPTGVTELMLHVWSQDGSQKQMMHAETEADGSFKFEEVTFETGLFFSVMATYDEANYFSEPASVEPGQLSLTIDCSVSK